MRNNFKLQMRKVKDSTEIKFLQGETMIYSVITNKKTMSEVVDLIQIEINELFYHDTYKDLSSEDNEYIIDTVSSFFVPEKNMQIPIDRN